MTDLEVFADTEKLCRAAADRIARTLQAALNASETVTFALTGGNTPRPVYELLAQAPYRDELAWKRIDFFWGDERTVPPDHPESNYGMARHTLLSRLSVPEARIHRILGELGDHEEASLRYEAEIRRVCGQRNIPAFDLVLLGMGEDGHTASLFPGTHWDETRWVVANYVPRLRTTRITMTPRLLNQARSIIFITSGQGKAPALKGVLEDPASDFPAKRIQPVDGSLTWMVDQAAASLMSSDE